MTSVGDTLLRRILNPTTLSSAPDVSTIDDWKWTSVVNNSWEIDVKSQTGTDMSFRFGSSWGFHSTVSSSLTFNLSGRTPNETYNDDGEIFAVFVGDNSYFTVVLSLDYQLKQWKVYPAPDGPQPPNSRTRRMM